MSGATRSSLTPLAFLALTACLHGDPVDDVSNFDDDTVLEMKTNPRSDRTTAEVTPGTELARADFRWERRVPLSLSGSLRGVDITTGEHSGWFERVAGGFGDLGLGGRGGVASSRSAPVSAPGGGDGGGAELEALGYVDAPMGAFSDGDMGEERHVSGGLIARQAANPLRAGTTDDNVDFGAYLEFLATWTDRPGVAGNHVPTDVSDRRFVSVQDAAGNPLPGARFSIIDQAADRMVWSGTTYGDGTAPFYPHLAGADSPRGDWLVQAEYRGRVVSVPWDGRDEGVELALGTERLAGPVDLDVVFVIDTTGSMSDEIDRIKRTLLSVTEQVNGLEAGVDLRYGAVLYRDLGDEYLTRHTPLTRDVQGFNSMLQGIVAGGGGDGPESLNQGLSVAVSEMDWRQRSAKVVFLVADAPPHMDYQDDTTYADASLGALAEGIRVHTVAASGLDDFGSLVFRQSAQLGRGKFVFIEYGSTAASAADHGVTGSVSSNNLDHILFEQLRTEVEGWGVPGSEIVATRR